MVSKDKFKNSSGQYLLRGLFFEETGADKTSVVYTLKHEDHMGYPSLYRLYMLEADPTEYRVAVNHLFGWQQWEMLSECTWFKPHLAIWRRELSTKLRAEALHNIRLLADPAKATAFQANKFLLEGNWNDEKPGRGRPSKAEVKRVASELADTERAIQEDLRRVLAN